MKMVTKWKISLFYLFYKNRMVFIAHPYLNLFTHTTVTHCVQPVTGYLLILKAVGKKRGRGKKQTVNHFDRPVA